MKRLRDVIVDFNTRLYNPVGLNILWPQKVAFMFVRIPFRSLPPFSLSDVSFPISVWNRVLCEYFYPGRTHCIQSDKCSSCSNEPFHIPIFMLYLIFCMHISFLFYLSSRPYEPITLFSHFQFPAKRSTSFISSHLSLTLASTFSAPGSWLKHNKLHLYLASNTNFIRASSFLSSLYPSYLHLYLLFHILTWPPHRHICIVLFLPFTLRSIWMVLLGFSICLFAWAFLILGQSSFAFEG